MAAESRGTDSPAASAGPGRGGEAAADRKQAQLRSTVAPTLPLAVLEQVRQHDRPSEVLEDEDLTASLPRRLGLKGVVDSQIQRYEEARRRGRAVPAEDVANLLRLVLRRPDGEAILREAGRSIARAHYARLPAAARSAMRILPRRAMFGTARRSSRRMLRRIVGGGTVELPRKPFSVRITGGVGLQSDVGGSACALFGASLEELLSLYTGVRERLRQQTCSSRGDGCCEWVMAEPES